MKIRDGETIREFIQRLKKKIRTPEFRARKREENLIEDWKRGKISNGRRIGKKSPGAIFHSPGDSQ